MTKAKLDSRWARVSIEIKPQWLTEVNTMKVYTRTESPCVFPRIIARGDYFFFRFKRGRLFEGGDYFKLLTGSRALNILFYYLIKSKSYHTIWTEHRFLKCSKFGSLINFQSLTHYWSVLLDQIEHQLDREGIKEREDGKGGGGRGERLFERGDNQGTAIIRKNTVRWKR